MTNCQSCGMPMSAPEDYGAGRVGNFYCKHCTDEQGNLLPREVVREKMIKFQMQSLNKTQQQAETDVDKHMALMLAWSLTSSPPTTPAGSVTSGGGGPSVDHEMPSTSTFQPATSPEPLGPATSQPVVPASPLDDTQAQPSQPFSVPTPTPEPGLTFPAEPPAMPPVESVVSPTVESPVQSVGPDEGKISEPPLAPGFSGAEPEPKPEQPMEGGMPMPFEQPEPEDEEPAV